MRSKRALASVLALTVLAGVPTTIALLHEGFPTTEVDLETSTVWVTNGEQVMAGRLNDRIHELDAGLTGSSDDIDVLQDGGAYFVTDTNQGTVDRIDAAYVSLVDRVQIPVGSTVSYGADTLAILSPKGELWVVDASDRLQFDKAKTPSVAKLGADASAVVSKTGRVFGLSAEKNKLYEIEHPGAKPKVSDFEVPEKRHVSVVGETLVVLDRAKRQLVLANGTKHELPGKALTLQQPGPENSVALVSTSDSLLRVPLGSGDVERVDADIDSSVTADQISAPVWLDGCAYAAWAGAARYLYACDGEKPVTVDIDEPVSGDDLVFRVNHGVIALNNLRDGNAWIVSSDMRLVQNWAQLKPDQTEKQGEDGEEKPVKQSFADTLAERTSVNRPPTAVDDQFGVRPGRTTVLPVTANDIDPDGDVLAVTKVTPLPAEQGRLDIVEGGRSVQFTPADDVSGTLSFRYTIDDGRGGTASALVNAAIVPLETNAAPRPTRSSAVDAELGQSISYPVLSDWIDPDGDDIYLVGASSTTGDDVRFTPDGTVTFISKSGQTGSKEVTFTVSDGRANVNGSLIVTVNAPGTLDPVAVPDSGAGLVGTRIDVSPLENDRSPSGAILELAGVELVDGSGATVSFNARKSTVSLESASTGTFYAEYTLTAGAKSTRGLVRFDVSAGTSDEVPPVAVKDVAYVRPGESVRVPVLANDVSPSGRVLVVESVSKDESSDSLNVEVLGNSVVRVTAPAVLPGQVQLTYVVSDGTATATAGITVVPIPPLVVHQPPVAVDDSVVVRAGDITTIPVIENDYSPDQVPFTLDPELVSTDQAGEGAVAFVSENDVRYQAPRTPGQYSVSYAITDKYDQRATATVSILVTEPDKGSNRPPEARTLTARAFAGSTIPITVPLDGIDPDGDSVTFSGIVNQPALGRIASSTSGSFSYEAYPQSAGTDTFTYRVTDTYGASAEGTIMIGVIPRPGTVKPPIAVNDMVEVKPGKVASVPVLENDSDPNGYPIALEKKLPEVDKGLTASVHGKVVLVTAPEKEGVYLARYRITNGQGGQATAFVQVVVTEDATPRYPVVLDHVLEPDQVAMKKSVEVDVLSDATNPSGLASNLRVTTSGPNAKAAEVADDGTVTITPSNQRMAVTYGVTDPATGLEAQAFIVVPPRGDASAPPRIKPGLRDQIVQMNGKGSWQLDDIIDVPSGRPAKLVSSVSATNGQASTSGANGIAFEGAKDYRGPAAVTFQVNDGRDAGQTKDRVTTLVLPLTIGKPDQTDVPPTFTPPNITIEAGEAAVDVDLRASTFHPNPQVLSAVTYSQVTNSNSEIEAKLAGSNLSVSAPFGVQPGAKATVGFTVTSGEFTIEGSVNVTVVSSTRPLAIQKNAPQVRDIKRTQSVTVSNAVGESYWVNPFPDRPLKIVDAKASSSPAGVTVSHTATSITVSASSGAKIGDVNVTYTVEDATKDPARTKQTIGQLRVTIHDVPAQPKTPAAAYDGDSKAKVTITQPSDNGRPIDQYEIFANGKSAATVTSIGTHVIKGLTNGTAYTFTYRAHNDDGWGDVSAASNSVTPYGTPSAPRSPNISSSGNAPATLTLSWQAPSNTGGGAVTYEYNYDGSGWKNAGTATSAKVTGAGAGNHSFIVRAVNSGSGNTGPESARASVSVANPPPPSPSATPKRGDRSSTSGCASGCYLVAFDYSNLTGGRYTLTVQFRDAGQSGWRSLSASSFNLGTNGSGQTYSMLGTKGEHDEVRIYFQGPDTFYSSVSGAWG